MVLTDSLYNLTSSSAVLRFCASGMEGKAARSFAMSDDDRREFNIPEALGFIWAILYAIIVYDVIFDLFDIIRILVGVDYDVLYIVEDAQ